VLGVLSTTVHTTGINWSAVITISASVTLMVSVVGAVLVRIFNRSVGDQIDRALDSKVTPRLDAFGHALSDLDRRTSRLEGIEEGKRQAIAAAGVTTAS
jgi:hypothetical protein